MRTTPRVVVFLLLSFMVMALPIGAGGADTRLRAPAFAPAFAALQQPLPLLPTESLAFDYSDAVFVSDSISRFEAQYDSGAPVDLGIPVKITSGIVGTSSYKFDPIRTPGAHVLALRACNAAGCSGWSAPFAFAPLVAPTTAPGNIRKVPR